MASQIRCTRCGKTIKVSAQWAGQRVRITCPSCQHGLIASIPGGESGRNRSSGQPAAADQRDDSVEKLLEELVEPGDSHAPAGQAQSEEDQAEPSDQPNAQSEGPDLMQSLLADIEDDERPEPERPRPAAAPPSRHTLPPRVTDIATPPAGDPREQLDAELDELNTRIKVLQRSSRFLHEKHQEIARERRERERASSAAGVPQPGMFFQIMFGLFGVLLYYLFWQLRASAQTRTRRSGAQPDGVALCLNEMNQELAELTLRWSTLRRLRRSNGALPGLVNSVGPGLLACLLLLSSSFVAFVMQVLHPLAGVIGLFVCVVVAYMVYGNVLGPLAAAMQDYPMWPRPADAFPAQRGTYLMVCLLSVVVFGVLCVISGQIAYQFLEGHLDQLPLLFRPDAS